MKKFVLSFLFLCISVNVFAISEWARFSLITVGQGDELYSTFGHSAFRFYDPETGVDKIYNYGTFDFEDPDFYVKFTRGKLDYMLSISNFRQLMRGAQYENRSVTEQILNLDHEDVAALYGFLETNYLPENRFYKYDFFFDNCSTRLRDALAEICGDRLKFHFDPGTYKSFRQLIDEFLTNKKFQDLGMDIGLGAPADKKATAYDYMFLPEYLLISFNEATIDIDGETQPLVKDTVWHFEATPIGESGFSLDPAHITWSLFLVVLALSIYSFKSTKLVYALDVILFGFVGLLGVVLLLLWFATDHGVTAYNWDLIWAMPFNIIISAMLMRKKNLTFVQMYMIVYSFVLTLMVLGLKFIPQEINYAVIPVILTLIVRSGFIVVKIKREKLSNRRTFARS